METKLIKIFRIIFESLENESDDIIKAASMGSIEDWDSMGHLNLLSVIEEELDVSIPDSKALEFMNFQRILYFLEVENS